jgi:hypothetical protein
MKATFALGPRLQTGCLLPSKLHSVFSLVKCRYLSQCPNDRLYRLFFSSGGHFDEDGTNAGLRGDPSRAPHR